MKNGEREIEATVPASAPESYQRIWKKSSAARLRSLELMAGKAVA
jgi:hypothetical protein